MRVKPAPERMVRDPLNGQLLPEEGREVPDNQFWRRRILDGDVIVETASQQPVERTETPPEQPRQQAERSE